MNEHKSDLRFMPDTYAAEVETLPIISHAILWSTAVFVLVAIVWANFAMLDEVTHAEGRVIPSSQIQIVQNMEGGIVSRVEVRPRESVVAGQTLIVMDDTRFASSFAEGKLTSKALEVRIARLEAEISGLEFESIPNFPEDHAELLRNEIRLYRTRQQELKSALGILTQQRTQYRQRTAELRSAENKLSKNAALAQQELELTEPLVESGAVS